MEVNNTILSNTGLSDMFKLPNSVDLTFEVKECSLTGTNLYFDVDKTIKENTEEYTMISEDNRDSRFRDYINKLKSVADRNVIQDTDKVFFNKSSLFPRISFNRYSTKAKRVQSITAATKVVIGDINKMHARSSNSILIIDGDSFKEKLILNINTTNLRSNIENTDHRTRGKYSDFMGRNRWGNYMTNELTDALLIVLKDRYNDPTLTVTIAATRKIYCESNPSMDQKISNFKNIFLSCW